MCVFYCAYFLGGWVYSGLTAAILAADSHYHHIYAHAVRMAAITAATVLFAKMFLTLCETTEETSTSSFQFIHPSVTGPSQRAGYLYLEWAESDAIVLSS